MQGIRRIVQFESGHNPGVVHYTVYYFSGRQFNYTNNDNLPITVVNFLTSNSTISETLYIPDRGGINKKTIYRI